MTTTLSVEPSLLFTSAIRDSVVVRNSNGNPRLDKSRKRGKNDILQAGIHAVSQGRRWRLPEGPVVQRKASDYILPAAALRREPDPRDQRIRRPAVRR